MRGHLKQRSPGSWSLVIDMGCDENGKRQQRWSTVRGTKREAEKELTRLLRELDSGTYIEPSKLTVAEYLLSDESKGMAAGVKWFWQMFPKAIEATCDGKLRVHLYPQDADQQQIDAREPQQELPLMPA